MHKSLHFYSVGTSAYLSAGDGPTRAAHAARSRAWLARDQRHWGWYKWVGIFPRRVQRYQQERDIGQDKREERKRKKEREIEAKINAAIKWHPSRRLLALPPLLIPLPMVPSHPHPVPVSVDRDSWHHYCFGDSAATRVLLPSTHADVDRVLFCPLGLHRPPPLLRGYRRPSLNHPTPVSLSSLRDLTATSSTYNPPLPPSFSSSSSPSRSSSPISAATDGLGTLSLSSSTSQPIPIPKPPSSAAAHDHSLPVTPLTGRFDKGHYFAAQSDQSPPADRKPSSHKKYGRRGHRRHQNRRFHHQNYRPASIMRSDSSTFYSPVVSSTMPSSGRPASPQQQHRSRHQHTTKSVPGFHLSNLPRFHPSTGSQPTAGQQPTPPVQSLQHMYRQSSGSSRDGMWQYRENATDPRTTGRCSPSPSAPRLDPLNSPGPVTPLALEEAGSYLTAGTANSTGLSSRGPSNTGPAPDMVEKLMTQKNSRTGR